MKDNFSIRRIERSNAASLLFRFHYLKDISKSFKSGISYGCFEGDKFFGRLVGVIVFTGFPVPELSVGMLGLKRDDQEGLFELSRLCMHPEIQGKEHNITSWFVGGAIRQLKKDFPVRVILSYADDAFHAGTIYKACNFGYYGLSELKSDFWKLKDGKYTKLSRGSNEGLEGEWRPRSRKHRYAMCFDKKLNIIWAKEPYPKSLTPTKGELCE